MSRWHCTAVLSAHIYILSQLSRKVCDLLFMSLVITLTWRCAQGAHRCCTRQGSMSMPTLFSTQDENRQNRVPTRCEKSTKERTNIQSGSHISGSRFCLQARLRCYECRSRPSSQAYFLGAHSSELDFTIYIDRPMNSIAEYLWREAQPIWS